MKKKLFTICFLTTILGSFSTNSASTSTGDFDDVFIIPPVIIRPPVNKQQLMHNSTLFMRKSTFVDRTFEL